MRALNVPSHRRECVQTTSNKRTFKAPQKEENIYYTLLKNSVCVFTTYIFKVLFLSTNSKEFDTIKKNALMIFFVAMRKKARL